MADITWRTASLPDAYAGIPYEAGLAETGALTAVTASAVVTGALPPGLALSADFVRITGTPKGSGIGQLYTFTISLTDTAGPVTSGTLTIRVRGLHNDFVKDGTAPVLASLAQQWPNQY